MFLFARLINTPPDLGKLIWVCYLQNHLQIYRRFITGLSSCRGALPCVRPKLQVGRWSGADASKVGFHGPLFGMSFG